jgi:hypothetical protein
MLKKAGTTDVSVTIRIIDSTDGTPETGVDAATGGLVLEYRRELEDSVSLATIVDLAALTTAHTDKGIKHIGNGYYRLDLVDAACAAGATGVLIHGTATGMVVIGEYIELVAYDPQDAVRLGLSSLPNAAADAAGGLPISDAGGLDLDAMLDVAISTRLATADYTAPPSVAAIQAELEEDGASLLDTLADRLTAARAGYFDNLNIGGLVAGVSDVTALQINTRANLSLPVEIETPDAGTQVYKIRVHLFDETGAMEAPDSTPTIALTNAAGTDRSGRLSVASNPSTGVYAWDYTATAGDAEEQLVWVFTVVEGGATRTYAATSYVVEETAYRFTSSDRSTLQAAATQASVDAVQATADTIGGYIDTEVQTLLDRLGAFTGSGVNTVLGFFQALLSKIAPAPSDVGGTFNPAADSVEAIRDRGDSAWTTGGAGGAGVQDLLEANRYIDKTQTPWQLVLIKAGTGDLATGTRLLVQNLTDVDGGNVTSTSTVIGGSVAP